MKRLRFFQQLTGAEVPHLTKLTITDVTIQMHFPEVPLQSLKEIYSSMPKYHAYMYTNFKTQKYSMISHNERRGHSSLRTSVYVWGSVQPIQPQLTTEGEIHLGLSIYDQIM